MEKSNNSSGVGVLGLLGVAFVVLKLVNIINWSWWLVTLPFWGGLVVFLIVLIVWALVQLNRKEIIERPKQRSKFAERLEEAKKSQINK